MDEMSEISRYNIHGGPPVPKSAALLVIDMQEHFTQVATAVLPAVNALISAARKAGRPVIFTQHGHRDLTIDGGVLARWWDNDLSMVGDPGWHLLHGLDVRPSDTAIQKTRYSAFFGTDLGAQLAERKIEHLVICGVLTNCCCETTARDAFMRDFNVVVVADAMAAENDDLHLSSLKGMAYACARVMTRDSVTAALSG